MQLICVGLASAEPAAKPCIARIRWCSFELADCHKDMNRQVNFSSVFNMSRCIYEILNDYNARNAAKVKCLIHVQDAVKLEFSIHPKIFEDSI